MSRTRARSVAASKRGRGQLRHPRRGAVLVLGGAAVALTILTALWRPPFLARAASTSWEAFGPALLLFPLWVLFMALALRWRPRWVSRTWRGWVGLLLVSVTLVAIPSALGGLEVRGLSLESRLGALLTGETSWLVWVRALAPATAGFILVFPRTSWRALLKGIGATWVATVKGLWLGRWATSRLGRAAKLLAVGSKARTMIDVEPAPPMVEESLPRIVLPERAQRQAAASGSSSRSAEDAPSGDEREEEERVEDSEDRREWLDIPPPVIRRGPSAEARDPFANLPRLSWRLPPLELLAPESLQQVDDAAHLRTAEAIEKTLADYGIEAQVTEVRPGPTVTLYGVRPGWARRYRQVRERDAEGKAVSRKEEVGRTRIKVDRIAALDRDLAMQLQAPSIRIEAPIPSTNLVGIEVPNPEPQLVVLRSLLRSEAFERVRARSKLGLPLGKGAGGEDLAADLDRMPHLLIAGATGSGKSVFINSLILSLLMNVTPDEVRLLLVDPKRVELTGFDGVPHLLAPVIVDTDKVVNALLWLIAQMKERLETLAAAGARDIASYNRKQPEEERLPYLVLVVDELADLMMTAGKNVEQGLVRLAQMGRATGIHLVVATQRPSVDVITGLIKANFPTRISFMVTSSVDSRTILDGGGAEKLLGRGDLLYLPQDAARPRRVQGAYVSEEETQRLAAFWRTQAGGYVPSELPDMALAEAKEAQGQGSASASEDLMEQAREMAQVHGGRISTSLLQRKLRIGYPRAARLKDMLVEEGLAFGDIPNAPAETHGRGRRARREG